MNENTSATPKYVGKRNQHGQIDVVRAEQADQPHVYVTWWDGGMYRRACIPASEEPGYRPGTEHRSVLAAQWVD